MNMSSPVLLLMCSGSCCSDNEMNDRMWRSRWKPVMVSGLCSVDKKVGAVLIGSGTFVLPS